MDKQEVGRQFQQFVKKGIVFLVPAILVTGAVGTAVWRYTMDDRYQTIAMKSFMVLVILQLLPLLILKVKMWVHADRVSLVPLALVKTVMMHVALQSMRLFCHFYEQRDKGMMLEKCINVLTLLAALHLLDSEFDLPLRSLEKLKLTWNTMLLQHKDVISLVLGAAAAGFATEYIYPSTLDGTVRPHQVLTAVSNFLEILNFIPAVVSICMESGVEDNYTVGTSIQKADKRKVTIFMGFILAFYFWDDVVYCVLMGEDSIVAAAKAAHFFMLLDFAGFFVLQVGASPKFVEEMLPSVVPEAVPSLAKDEQMKGLLGAEDDDEDVF